MGRPKKIWVLKSCPFCSKKADDSMLPVDRSQSLFWVRCSNYYNCGAETSPRRTKQAAVNLWNRRGGKL